MRMIEQFTDFLEDTVNLNQTRIDRLEGHVYAIENFLNGSTYHATIERFSPQGSWAHKTIIKPIERGEFDADLVMFVKPLRGWSARDYVDDLYRVFGSSQRYKDKVSRGTRCAVLDYSGDFHLDIVPCVVNVDHQYKFNICNRKQNIFEPTASEEYTRWLTQRNEWTGRSGLQQVTRLLKYLRDIKKTFSVKSILLTTLLGNLIDLSDTHNQEIFFSDLPTSLKTLIGRLDVYLQANPALLVVQNPVLSQETFNRHWDQEKYENFRACIHRYREWIDDAYDEDDYNESIRKWRRVFGDDFARKEGQSVAMFSESVSLIKKTGYRDVVTAVLYKGSDFLSNLIPINLPHVKRLPWSIAKNTVPVKIIAKVYDNSGYHIISSGDVVEKNVKVQYEALHHNGFPFSHNEFVVKWQVVNTDEQANSANQLRGDFYSSDTYGVRSETTRYRGAHWVEAFVILKRNNQCLGRSGRFFIVVK